MLTVFNIILYLGRLVKSFGVAEKKKLTMVHSPDTREETRSLPARAATMVL